MKDTRKDGSERGLRQRLEDSRRVHRETHDPRRAIAEWCRGNRWAEENARAVGNWPTNR